MDIAKIKFSHLRHFRVTHPLNKKGLAQIEIKHKNFSINGLCTKNRSLS